jgi:hypothetical protein
VTPSLSAFTIEIKLIYIAKSIVSGQMRGLSKKRIFVVIVNVIYKIEREREREREREIERSSEKIK